MAETMRESILEALRDLLASDPEGFFPPAVIDEPDPTGWTAIDGVGPRLTHACAVQDGPPPDQLAFVRAGEDDQNCDELELEAMIAYVVTAAPGLGDTAEDLRGARRARRDAGVRRIAGLISANRNLGLSLEVYAEVRPAQRDDDVGFKNAEPGAVALVPVRILYTAASAAD